MTDDIETQTELEAVFFESSKKFQLKATSKMKDCKIVAFFIAIYLASEVSFSSPLKLHSIEEILQDLNHI